ncbi:ribosomal protein L13 domain-containing protein [Fomitopsis serialis]|uniref:ribosomal protein L13 domain-containing protein n=1 Tax=Fomitopsis serialis TaxID=139415 RepID=UPI002007EBA7|nr:ribosomal protein L13 domain-containing protein [Neoantrodia serialis]KAH9913211.1 ribosomal protein L13 domain-containing protein [Neoantrodia serialis]
MTRATIGRHNARPPSPDPVVIDGKGHFLGRLASIISKQVLNGQKIVVVRCEEINTSGSFFRNKYPAIRGMVPHKTARGAAALERLKLFDGVSPPHDRKKRMVVLEALRVLRLKPGRKYCVTVKGYKGTVVDRLEEKRKIKAQAFHERKLAAIKLRERAVAGTASSFENLTQLGY